EAMRAGPRMLEPDSRWRGHKPKREAIWRALVLASMGGSSLKRKAAVQGPRRGKEHIEPRQKRPQGIGLQKWKFLFPIVCDVGIGDGLEHFLPEGGFHKKAPQFRKPPHTRVFHKGKDGIP